MTSSHHGRRPYRLTWRYRDDDVRHHETVRRRVADDLGIALGERLRLTYRSVAHAEPPHNNMVANLSGEASGRCVASAARRLT
jgi:hypothetical protein